MVLGSHHCCSEVDVLQVDMAHAATGILAYLYCLLTTITCVGFRVLRVEKEIRLPRRDVGRGWV